VGPPARHQGGAVTFNEKAFLKFLRELMDNLTHTLIGLIAGESVAHTTSRALNSGLAPEKRRGLFVAIAAIGGNLPDLDLVYSYRGVPHDTQAKLGYVLQHRGYTHTVLGCLVLAALLYAGAELWLRYRHLAVTRRDRLELAGMCMFGTFLHLGMDFLNSYGVHPFWPVQNGWFYGDSVFIVEPLYWNVLLLETNGDQYVVRHAVVSSTPVLLSANECPPL
jgi:inner membrane protein